MIMEALTTNEVVALFDLDERRVRKEVEHGVIDASSPPRFGLSAVVYLITLGKIGFEVSAVDDRKKLYSLILRGVTKLKTSTIELSPIIDLKLGDLMRDVTDRIERFVAWRRRLVASDRVLGGEPVASRTRLAVRHVGGMLLRGAAVDEVRGDYPYLSDEDSSSRACTRERILRLGGRVNVKLLLDENLSPKVAEVLRRDGIDACGVRDRGTSAIRRCSPGRSPRIASW